MTFVEDGGSDAVLHKTKMCRFYGMGMCSKGVACTFAHSRTDLQKQPDLQKTHLCLAYQRNGFCRDGSACKYAHGDQDLRKKAAAQHRSTVKATKQQETPYHSDLANMLSSVPEIMLPTTMPMPANVTLQTSPSLAAVDLFIEDKNWGDSAKDDRDRSSSDATTSYQSNGSLVSDTASTEADSVKDDSSSQGSVTVQPKQCDFLRGTKMCKFYPRGLCRRGAACNYAHDQGALREQPDLFRTRICLSFSRTGICKDGDYCKYAHGVDRLRTATDENWSQISEASMAGGASKQEYSCEDFVSGGKSWDPYPLKLDLTQSAEPIFMTFDNGRVCLHQRTSNA